MPSHIRGRPTTRSDRWYALLSLTYCIASIVVDAPEERETRTISQGVRTARDLTAEICGLAPKSVNNALADAAESGLFTRHPGTRTPHARNSKRGYMTAVGWATADADGVPEEWRTKFGPSFRLGNDTGLPMSWQDANDALVVLKAELAYAAGIRRF